MSKSRYEYLNEASQQLYAELLELSIHAAAADAAEPLPPGTFVDKKVRGLRYWYLQTSVGGRRVQRYLGPDSADLRQWMEAVARTRAERRPDFSNRGRLAAMLVQGGAAALGAALFRVVEVLADAGVFRLGGVLVGTHAFGPYGNMLGIRWRRSMLRTHDIDIAQDPVVGVGLQGDAGPSDIPAALEHSELGFFGIPTLDPRQPSTSFKIRGQELRVDFLTPLVGPPRPGPVHLSSLRVSAQPLRLLDYLIERPVQALMLGRRRALLVNVPDPARFALHKLWTSGRRAASFHAKAVKDLVQASALLEFLTAERTADVERAWEDLGHRPKVRQDIRRALDGADDGLFSERVRETVAALP
ncbi:MAG: nucleotidyltransferase domain-containing protein [Acidobacteriota bacterium]